MLPAFTVEGLLPAGDYQLSLAELMVSHLVTGAENQSVTWDGAWRGQLVHNLGIIVAQLWAASIEEIFIDGSFVEDKDHPNDIDGYFNCGAHRIGTRELQASLNAIDPYKVWTWSWADRLEDPNLTKPQLPMWTRYKVEMYPNYGNLSGIVDEFGRDQPFPAAFRKSRSENREKGIVRIVR